MDHKTGDWVTFDLSVGHIKELRDNECASFSDGSFETSGFKLTDRFRPLTLRNKRIVENFKTYYDRLHEIDGEAGFNYPAIHAHFSDLALRAIDYDTQEKALYERAQQFVVDAKGYKPLIQGVSLFRPKLPKRSSGREVAS